MLTIRFESIGKAKEFSYFYFFAENFDLAKDEFAFFIPTRWRFTKSSVYWMGKWLKKNLTLFEQMIFD